MDGSQTVISAICNYSSSSSMFTIILVLSSIASYFLIPILFKDKPENWRNAPPGPTGWPILGILPHINGHLHHYLFHLAKEYGPLVSLKMGMKPTLVVSSPEMAHEVLKVQDLTFSSRTINEAIKIAAYGPSSVAFSPYGPRWILIRKMVMSEILSAKSLKAFEPLRRKQVHGMLKQLYRVSLSNGSIDIADSAFLALANQISNLVASKSVFDSTEKGSQIKAKFFELLRTCGTPNISDLIPILKPFDPQGLRRKLLRIFATLDAFYDELIDNKLEEKKKKKKTTTMSDNEKRDLLDVLLGYRSEKREYGYETLPREVIKGVISDMFMGGTETSSSTIEWGMTEIIRKPEVYQKVIAELDHVVGKDRFVEESDIANLPYFQAVMKEVFRLHPALPLLASRRTDEACQVKGYDVPKHCIVFVNIWGISRDPKVWENPLEFKPERFIGSNVDVLGQNFELLPFGTGRRYCVGMLLGHKMVHLYVAALLHAFEWDFPKEILNDSSEDFGLTIQKGVKLVGTAKPRLADFLYH